ncbi:MAG: HAMP domain-containing histidine kinase [Acidimicrobiia bacterium]|nr:HAMP domain-containing histidine kinase [Acidimicrobiia bacterium]
MRQRLNLVAAAVTSMVAIAFIVPLALSVRSQARDGALADAEQAAQGVATGVAVAESVAEGVSPATVQAILDAAGNDRVSVLLTNGAVIGLESHPDATVIAAAAAGAAFTVEDERGATVFIPVVGRSGTIVVQGRATTSELRSGVLAAWGVLAGLGVVLVLGSVLVADRLARTVTKPVDELAGAVRRLGGGDLDVRVTPSGPIEVSQVGEAVNMLASRLESLLRAERESMADLSHRLRTPLTSLRLQAETVTDPNSRDGLLAEVDRLEFDVDQIIDDVRRSGAGAGPAVADLAEVVRHQVAYWSVLAQDQDRKVTTQVPTGEIPVGASVDDVVVVVDTLIENIFSHTESGIGFNIEVTTVDSQPLLIVTDDGPGVGSVGSVQRGDSGSGSTGLGLDIVRRMAERSGGRLTILEPPEGSGSRIEVRFGRPAVG